ncbi:hypothetical protein BLNAU_21718 [Blattamonas nauphoetae]|uniref:Uncharacterized protein n=1 Tax=Blattamonas nauphoetae TaxID=2049346 RepID=A0ABQ9WV43_9EUKA|nr:hypothetical protein BLNAU_21718 [Blattamonas nauphoetae]
MSIKPQKRQQSTKVSKKTPKKELLGDDLDDFDFAVASDSSDFDSLELEEDAPQPAPKEPKPKKINTNTTDADDILFGSLGNEKTRSRREKGKERRKKRIALELMTKKEFSLAKASIEDQSSYLHEKLLSCEDYLNLIDETQDTLSMTHFVKPSQTYDAQEDLTRGPQLAPIFYRPATILSQVLDELVPTWKNIDDSIDSITTNVVIITHSSTRAWDLLDTLKTSLFLFLHPEHEQPPTQKEKDTTPIVSLYSRHLKLESQLQELKEKKHFAACVGTPARLSKLFQTLSSPESPEKIDLETTKLFVVDMFHDQKQMGIFSSNDSKDDALSFLAHYAIRQLMKGTSKIVFF